MSKSFPEKMKNFFRRTESYTYNFDGVEVETFTVTLEMLKDISSESSTSHRLRTLKEIQEHVLTKKLADNAIEAIYTRIQDLLSPQQSLEVRHETFNFYIALIQGQVEYMQIMRTILFRDIVMHTVPEDIIPRFGMLKTLTDDGKNILNFEIEMGYFLMREFYDFLTPDLAVDFLRLVINVIKFNAAYVDEEVIVGFMTYLERICFSSYPVEVIQECLNLMEAILCYSHLPMSELDVFISILCYTVNTEALLESSWKQMRNLLCTSKGVMGIISLGNILKEMRLHQSVLRGAVYFLGMALWDTNRVPGLIIPPSTVLPAFAKVIETNSFVIAREIVLAMTRLVVNYPDQLESRSLIWDTIFCITDKIQKFPEFRNFSQPMDICVKELNDFLTACEEKCPYEMDDETSDFLSMLLDNYSVWRSDQSMIRLVSYRANGLRATKPNFIPSLNKLLEKYFKNEKRTPVLLEVLKTLKEIRLLNLRVIDEDLMDQVILQNLANSDQLADVIVRKAVIEFLSVIAESINSSLFLDVLDIMEKIMKRMVENLKVSGSEGAKETFLDVIAAVEGLIHVFKRKLFMMPPNHCVEIFHLFVKHMQQQYLCPSYTEDAVKVRKLILEFFFEIRANKYRQVGVLRGSGTGHSVYLMCDTSTSRDELVPSSPPPQSPSAFSPVIAHLGFDKGFQVIISCLKEERDWRILEMALKEIPILLQNKSLILRSNCSVGTLCSTVCLMVSDRNSIHESLKNAPLRFNRTEFNCHIFPCAVAFTSYHSNMEGHIQRLLIRSLQSGLVSRSARSCIEGLTLCLLEMKNSMNKLLPDVLLKLSKISATKIVALPVLEFLSNLIRLPELFKTFVEDQYMSIFAIALPYTNPYKFNQYTVALAHHVLSMWYLKCRIPFRRDFAKFIMKGLRSNIDVPRSEGKNTSNQSLDQGLKAKDDKTLLLGQSSRSNQNSPREDTLTEEERKEKAIFELHTELMETGLDLMTRFTFGMCSNLPERSPVDEFLLEKGQKTCWLIGNKIITITTSGSGTKTFKNGLCEVCYKSTHPEVEKSDEFEAESVVDPDSSDDPKNLSFQLKKKRHRSAIHRRNTTLSEEIATNASKIKDDIMLHYSSSPDSSASARRHTSYVPDTDRFSTLSQGDKQDKGRPLCSCWITSWAEVHIRRPTGNTSWMIRMQNKLTLPSQSIDVPLSILNSLVLPHLERELEIGRDSPSESDVVSLLESEMTEEPLCAGAIEITSKPKTTPPMRRTNSSPDMNTGWLSNLESKQSLLESSTEIEREDESQLEPLTSQTSSLKQRVTEKSKSKNLKLDFAPLSHGESSSKEAGPTLVKGSMRASSIGQRQHSNEAEPQPSSILFRDRSHTTPVMSPNSKLANPTGAETSTKTSEANPRNGMSPSFVFLQLFQDSVFGITSPKPLLIPHSEANHRALAVFDHIPPYDCHKIGVVYIGPDQAENEVAILSNVGGSSRYVAFLRGLGRMVRLRKTDPHTTYLGGLDTRGEDGDYALIWHDDVMQVVFHEATLMKNKESDKNRNEKKKHIANDCVMIAYNESGSDFNISTIKGHVTNACIVVKPEDFNCNVVTVSYRIKDMMESFGHTNSYMVSDDSLAVFVRQMALHANLASMLISRRLQGNKYTQVSNWLERLRAIKRLRSKLEEDWKSKNADNYAFETEPSDYTDFTDYV